MDINAVDIVVLIILLISGSVGYIATMENSRRPYERIVIFQGAKGRLFLSLLGIGTLLVLIGSAIYLGFSAWLLCAIGVPLNFIINRYLSPFTLWLIVPLYSIYSLLYRGEE